MPIKDYTAFWPVSQQDLGAVSLKEPLGQVK
jgi:hypothetical protein